MVKQDVVIRVNDDQMHGWFFQNPASPYVVLVNHGNSGNVSSVEWIAHNLLAAGVSVLLYDYRGYGHSQGSPTVESICQDGDAAYTFLTQERGYHPDKVILYGQSLGCAVACHITTTHKVEALILQSGFSSLRHVAFQRFPLLRHAPSRLVPDALDNQAILSQSKLPLLVIHGDKDKIVPFSNGEDLYQAAGGKKWLVVCHNAGHRLYPCSDAQHRDAVGQFIRLITASPSSTDLKTAALHSAATASR